MERGGRARVDALGASAAALIARVVRQHADKCGDGSRAMVGAIAAGLRRAAEACGDGPPDGPVARERRARLVNALVRLSRGAAAAVLFETLTRVAVVAPRPATADGRGGEAAMPGRSTTTMARDGGIATTPFERRRGPSPGRS